MSSKIVTARHRCGGLRLMPSIPRMRWSLVQIVPCFKSLDNRLVAIARAKRLVHVANGLIVSLRRIRLSAVRNYFRPFHRCQIVPVVARAGVWIGRPFCVLLEYRLSNIRALHTGIEPVAASLKRTAHYTLIQIGPRLSSEGSRRPMSCVANVGLSPGKSEGRPK